MAVSVKYTVKYHPRRIRKVSNAIMMMGAIPIIIIGFFYSLLNPLPAELQVFALHYIIPDIFDSIFFWAFAIVLMGFGLSLLKWRSGKVEINQEQLMIDGSLGISIWIRNILDMDFIDAKKTILINAKTDAIKVKFKNEKEFNNFVEKLIDYTKPFESVKINTWA